MRKKTLEHWMGWIVVIAMGVAGLVHIRIAPEHLEHTVAHGLFFGLVGLAQLFWTASHFWKRNFQRGSSAQTGILLSGGVIVVWMISHWVASPFSTETHPSDVSTFVTKGAELIVFGGLLYSVSTHPQHKARQKKLMILLSTGVGGGVAVWLAGMILTPLLPSLGEVEGHHQANMPTAAVLSTSAYFSIVNSAREADRLTLVTSDEVDDVSLHQTTVEADHNMARMRALTEVELNPHVRVDFAPVGNHVMLDGVFRELYEGDYITLTLHFASGKTIPVEFAVTLLPPTERINFVNIDGFQITNAWVRATSASAGVTLVDAGNYQWQLPQGFPLPRVPENNPMTEEKVALGQYLFYDPRLSGNGTMSCSSCHLQELAFTDGVAQSIGSTGEVHPRNSMSLTNVAYNATFTWANPTLLNVERQIPIPLFGEHPIEMGVTGNEDVILDRLRQDALYQTLFANAFPNIEDPFTFNNITLSLASFNRTLISGNSPYDQYLRGNRDALSESAIRGMEMFFSESLECHHCHTGFNLTLSTITANSTFEERPFFNTGMYNIGGTGAYPADNTGIYEITNNPADMGRFRPPTLRNIAITGPYMHDGSFATLTDVIQFYMAGGHEITEGDYAGDGRYNPYKNGFVSGFNITEQEMADLVAFLESLTDEEFITDPRFSNPFTANDLN